jgi:uncharacterized Zn finger protein (UPF0148 family)
VTVACNYCGDPILVEEQDGGFEVYCPSCGRANYVPLTLDSESSVKESQGTTLPTEETITPSHPASQVQATSVTEDRDAPPPP